MKHKKSKKKRREKKEPNPLLLRWFVAAGRSLRLSDYVAALGLAQAYRPIFRHANVALDEAYAAALRKPPSAAEVEHAEDFVEQMYRQLASCPDALPN